MICFSIVLEGISPDKNHMHCRDKELGAKKTPEENRIVKLQDSLAAFPLHFSRLEAVSNGLPSLGRNHFPCAAHLAEAGQEHTTDSLAGAAAAAPVPCEALDAPEDLDSEAPSHNLHN